MNLQNIPLACHWKFVALAALASTLFVAGLRVGAAAEATAAPGGPDHVLGLYLWFKADSLAGLKDGEVVTRWNDSGSRKIHLDKHQGSPIFVGKAINQLPAVRFKEGRTDGLQTSAAVEALAGNLNVTVFLVAKVARTEQVCVQPLGWGNGATAGRGMFLEFEANRLDFGTGCSADASTPNGAYAACFDKPAIMMCAKSAGPMNSTTRVTLNGTAAAITGSDIVPDVLATPLNVGGDSQVGFVSPAMDVAEIIIYSRVLSLSEQNRVGCYLQQKYDIDARFVRPEDFVLVDLEVRAEPSEVEAAAGFVGKGQQVQGTTVEVVASESVVLRDASGARAFLFDHWQGGVAQPASGKTAVQMAGRKTITAVYKERKMVLYVAPNGRDDWSGTFAEPNAAGTDGPFATLSRARDAIRQLKSKSGGKVLFPVKVLVRGGTYFLREPLVFTSQDSGPQEFPVAYTAYPGEKPVLSGGRRVTGWQPYKGKIVQCSVAEGQGSKGKFRRLFYMGRLQIRARTPNLDPQNPYRGGWATVEGPASPGNQSAFKYKPGTFPRHWAKPSEGEVNCFFGSNWGSDTIPINSVDQQKRTITLVHDTRDFVKSPLCYSVPTPFGGQSFRVENILEELDQPGEWCWDSEQGTLYFWPPDGSSQPADVVIPRLDCLVAFNGAKHITLSGFTFTATTGGDDFHPHSVEGVGAMFPMKGWKYCGQAVLFRGAEHCCIQDSSFYGVGGNAVYLEGYNLRNAVRRNRIDHAGACGVGLAGAKSQNQYPLFNEIVGNRINHSGTMNNYSAGIFAGLSEGNVIGHNAIHDVPHHAINLGNSGFSRNIVEYNDVRRTCLETSDTGAINCWMEDTSQTSQRQGHVIRYNRVVDSPERGLYMDNDTSNCFVYGNVFLRCGQAILVHGGKNNVIENNVIVRCQAGIWYANWINSFIANMLGFQTGNRFCHNIVYDVKNALNPSSTMTDRTVAQSDQNLFFKTADADSYLRDWRKAGFEMHSLIADPLFVDPAHEDFRLRPESPAFKLGFQAIDFAKIGPGGSD